MNLFVLSPHPGAAASALCDQHVNKMILETAQILDGGTRPILANIYPGSDLEIVKIPKSHRDNRVIHSVSCPVVHRWARRLYVCLLTEFECRYDHPHSYSKHLSALIDRANKVEPGLKTRGYVLAMPDRYKASTAKYVTTSLAVDSYRAYYAGEKTTYGKTGKPATWRGILPPQWLITAREKKHDQLRYKDGRYYFERLDQ